VRESRGALAFLLSSHASLESTPASSGRNSKNPATRSTLVPADPTVQANHLAQTCEAMRMKFPLMMARMLDSLYPNERKCSPTCGNMLGGR
jgi:hypothetical protein